MKRTVKIVAVLAVVAMVAPAVMASAATPWLTRPAYEGDAYRRPNVQLSERPVRMPGIASGGDMLAASREVGATTAGPQVAGDDLFSPRGSALVNPTGSGPMYTPKEQGDRQIEQLIKKLG